MTDPKKPSIVIPSASADAKGTAVSELSPEEFGDLLTSFAPAVEVPQIMANLGDKEQRKAPRYRVRWNAEIVVDDKSRHRGFINDISILGASICLNNNVNTTKCSLRIFVPPLSSVTKSHVIEATGQFVYIVFDGRLQVFRLAVSFINFYQESDRKLLEDRLIRHHSQIPEH